MTIKRKLIDCHFALRSLRFDEHRSRNFEGTNNQKSPQEYLPTSLQHFRLH